MSPDLKILVVDSNIQRAAIVMAGLKSVGEVAVAQTTTSLEIKSEVIRFGADVVIVACDSPDRDTLECMRDLNAEHPRPIVMFVERSDPSFAREAVRVGVSAYIVAGLSENRVRPILEVAISRFEQFQALHAELDKAKSDLTSRKAIERAKGILMERNGLNEADAYNTLRRSAMAEGKTIVEIANAVIAVTRLLKA